MSKTEELLELVDFDCPGLEEAKALRDEGRNDEAAKKLIERMRNRRTPKYLFDKDSAEFSRDPEIIEDAEKTMRHFIFSHQFPEKIDFTFNPTAETSRDNEWTWSLYRTIYWQPLGRAYAITGDEKYVREFASELKDFYEAWPAKEHIENTVLEMKTPFPGHAWRTIEAAMRIYTTWLPLMEIFRSSPSFDAETWIIFLLSIHDHGTFLLSHFSNHAKSSNWLSMETSALLQLGVMFPEFKDAAAWKDAGYQRAMHEIAYSFDEDGVHMERTPIYHMVATIAFLQAIELCRINGIYVPRYAYEKLEKAAEFILRLAKPDYSTPMLGDADRNDFLSPKADTSLYEGMNLTFFPEDRNEIRAFFRWMSKLTGRKDFLFVASGGKEGEEPKISDSKLDDAGIYVFRTGFGDEDYMMSQIVRLESGEVSSHSHSDAAHIELMLGGEDILIDCGRYIYNSSVWKDWRKYFLSAKAHNVFSVDDHYNGEVEGYPKRRGLRGACHSFVSNDEYKLLELSHNAFCYGGEPVFQRRLMVLLPKAKAAAVIDVVTGPGKEERDMSFHWNFARPNASLDGNDVVYSTPKGRKYRLSYCSSVPEWNVSLLSGSLEPKGGWVSYGYPIRIPTSQLNLEKKTRAPFAMATVIAPEGTTAEAIALSDRAEVRIAGRIIQFSEKGARIE